MESILSSTEVSVNDIQHSDATTLSKLIAELQQSKADLEARRFIETSLAKFADLMRWQAHDTLSLWVDRLLVEMAPTVGALQACMYMSSLNKEDVTSNNGRNGQVNRENHIQNDNDETYLETDNRELLLVGAYAHDDENTFHVIKFGKGLVGQSAKSKRTITFSQNAKIETRAITGLALLHPRALIIQPLIYNDTVEGVLEISSIEDFSAQQVDFIKILSESIAANLLTIRNQEEMRHLYKTMQAKTEALTAQEEEMRQNMEEMAATQEELARLRGHAEQQAALQRGAIDSLANSLVAVDNNLNVILFNASAKKMSENLGTTMEMNSPIEKYYCRDSIRAIQKDLWNRAINGESFQTEGFRYTADGKSELIFAYGYSPIYNLNKDVIIGACILEKDITEERQKQYEFDSLKIKSEYQSELLQSLLDNLHSGILKLSLSFVVETYNKKAKEFINNLGINLDIGVDFLSEVSENRREMYLNYFQKAISGETSEFTYPIENKYKERTEWVTVYFMPMIETGNKITGIILEFQVITEKRKSEVN